MFKAHLPTLAVLLLSGQTALATTAGGDPFELDPTGNGATGERSPFVRPLTVAIRVQPPISGEIATSRTGGSQGFEALGAAVGLRALSLVEAEMAGVVTATICESGSALIARAGVVPSVLQPDVNGTRWDLRVPVLASYIRYSGSSSCSDTYSTQPSKILRGYLFSTGFEATHWGASGRVGFDMRALVGFGVGSARDSSAIGQDKGWGDAGRVSELNLSLGILFQ
jgi:hypothetical protein